MSEPQQRGERSSGTASAVLSVELIPGLSRDNAATRHLFRHCKFLVRRFATCWITLHLRKNEGGTQRKTFLKFHFIRGRRFIAASALCWRRARRAVLGERVSILYWLCKQTASTASTRPFVRPPQ